MKISVFGLGYVGAVSCACLPELGHDVIGVDVAESKVRQINDGQAPIIETGLAEALAKAVKAGRLRATTDADEAVASSDLALLCVGTPSMPSGAVNSEHLQTVCRQIGEAVGRHRPDYFAVLNRSTSLPPIHGQLQKLLEKSSGRRLGHGLGYVCHPEFLREGVAVHDFHHPPKIVFGVADKHSGVLCRELYPGIEAPTFVVSPEVAAMVKYADNCFHAVKVTFGNEIGLMCQALGVDSHAVMELFCQDTKLNISARYLKPGSAFGGSCLPKDLRAMLDAARNSAVAVPMLGGVLESNRLQVQQLLARIISSQRPHVGVVGLAFKEGTDDVRESPIVTVVEQACGKGHRVSIYDRSLSVGSLVGSNRSFALNSIPHLAHLIAPDLQSVVDACDVLLVSHRLHDDDWNNITWQKGQRVVDLVNIPALRSAPAYEGLYWD